MKAIDCPCGHRLKAANEDDEELRERIAKDAYEKEETWQTAPRS